MVPPYFPHPPSYLSTRKGCAVRSCTRISIAAYPLLLPQVVPPSPSPPPIPEHQEGLCGALLHPHQLGSLCRTLLTSGRLADRDLLLGLAELLLNLILARAL